MSSRIWAAVLVASAVAFLAPEALAESAAAQSQSPITSVVASLALILAVAKLGGAFAVRIGQPAVLGELVAGVLLGSLDDFGVLWFRGIEGNTGVDLLANLGVIILLFEVGLESTVKDMLKVGLPALLVAVLGVVTPFALGWGVGAVLLPDRSVYAHAFLGATLTATSVGITARVLQDLNRSQSAEAKVILGAAVIDDVLGLVILAVVSGVIGSAAGGGSLSIAGIGMILGKAVAFLVGALVLGLSLSRRMFGVASKLHGRGVLLAISLSFCFALASLASVVGLAPIVGAYAAGLILEDAHFLGFTEKGVQELKTLVHPISSVLAPVFFVLMGMRVELRAFAQWNVLGLAALLTLAAIIGKQACALGVGRSGLNRFAIGIGMTPRGEVGIIFANVGLALSVGGQRVVDEGTFSAVMIMVIVTTIVTPPALKWSFARGPRTEPSR